MASVAARYFFLFLVGLVIGSILTVIGMRAIAARQDPFPDALMHVQQHHLATLKRNVEANRCRPTDTMPHISALRMTSDDIETAFPDLRDDARFTKAAGGLRAALDAARASPPMNCQAAGKVVEELGNACKACHQDFRG